MQISDYKNTIMFKTKFKTINHDGSFIVIYKKWYQLS